MKMIRTPDEIALKLLIAFHDAYASVNGLVFLRGGAVEFRELRLISRQMQKLTGILSGEKNRLYKLLTDAGIRLSVILNDLNGKSARAIIKELLAGETPQEVLKYASKHLKATEEELLDALEGDINSSHHFVITEIMPHIQNTPDLAETSFLCY